MVETRGINENQAAVGSWVSKRKMLDGKVSGNLIVIDGGDRCSSGNVDELAEQSVH